MGVTTTRMPESRCPYCGRVSDQATSHEEGVEPSPGDITVCYGCLNVLAYDERLAIRELTEAEALDVAGDPRVRAYVNVLAKIKKEHGY